MTCQLLFCLQYLSSPCQRWTRWCLSKPGDHLWCTLGTSCWWLGYPSAARTMLYPGSASKAVYHITLSTDVILFSTSELTLTPYCTSSNDSSKNERDIPAKAKRWFLIRSSVWLRRETLLYRFYNVYVLRPHVHLCYWFSTQLSIFMPFGSIRFVYLFIWLAVIMSVYFLFCHFVFLCVCV